MIPNSHNSLFSHMKGGDDAIMTKFVFRFRQFKCIFVNTHPMMIVANNIREFK